MIQKTLSILLYPPPLPSNPDQSLQRLDLSKRARKQRSRDLVWTYTMEEGLFTTLLDKVRSGKRADSGFKQEAWVDALEAVRSRAPSNIQHLLSIEKIKSKESNYKAYYKDWKWLISQSDFEIHPETRCTTASPEAWDEVLRHRKSCKWHRHNALEFTELLDELYAPAMATASLICPQPGEASQQ